MQERIRIRRKQNRQPARNPWLGALCLLLAVLFVSAFFAKDASSVMSSFYSLENYGFGWGAFFLPVILSAFSLRFFSKDILLVSKKQLAALIYIALTFFVTAHHLLVPVNEELVPHLLPEGGGLVGGAMALVLHKIFGYSFTAVLLCVFWLPVLILFIPWQRVGELFSSVSFKRKRKAVPESISDLEAAEEEEDENEPFFRNKKAQALAAQVSENSRVQALATNSVRDIYGNDEFGAFTDGVEQNTTFKRIFKLKDNIYEEPSIKKELVQDPVQIPEWEEEKYREQDKVIVRPVIDYDSYQEQEQEPAVASEPLVLKPRYPILEEEEPVVTPYPSVKSSVFAEEVEAKTIASERVEIDSVEQVFAEPEAEQEMVEPQADGYKLPPFELLNPISSINPQAYEQDIMAQCAVLEQTLEQFKVRARVVDYTRGPSVTRFEIEPAPGVKVNSITNLSDDIALRLAAPGVRIEPVAGKSVIGIEVPNTKNDTVCFREVVENPAVRRDASKLCIGLGKDISGNIIPANLAKMPHLLVAGSTGSGKSVCINTLIAGILFKARPEEVKLILVDPKVVELSNYNGIPHLLTPVVTEPKKAASALRWAVTEMERRYQMFAEDHVREINSYNEQAQVKLPFIVIIIDELSDLMMVARADVEDAILRLAQKARAAGIHLVLATQRPSVDVITGIVKANIPSRIAFAVSSQTDSRTILDGSGAEKLLGKGDMLFKPIDKNVPLRVQGAFVSDAELNRIVDFIVKQSIPVEYSEEVTEQELECDAKANASEESGSSAVEQMDELFPDALRLVLDTGMASASMLQRRFRVGYTRAARLVDYMEEYGIVGKAVGSKPREVIMSRQEVEDRFLSHE